MIMLDSLIALPSTTIIELPNERKSQHSSRIISPKKKYKVLLNEHIISSYSVMLMTMEKEKNHNFVADIAFSSSSSSDSYATKDIQSIKESELADLIGKHSFRIFRIRGKSGVVMDITINREKKGQQYNHGDFVADIAFSSSSSSDSYATKDIQSIKESELADLVKKYRVFVECVKRAEYKELSRKTSKNTFQRIELRSVIQHVAHGMNVNDMKEIMIRNGMYVKNAALSTAKIRKIISEFNELISNSVKRDIYTKINVGGTLVTTRSTIELDADIVTVIKKQSDFRDLTLRNFIFNIHTSNVSLSTFLLLNKVNLIFSAFGAVIGFGRIAATPVSIYNSYLLLFSIDPFLLLYAALPTGLAVLLPRIARIVIRYRIRKALTIVN